MSPFHELSIAALRDAQIAGDFSAAEVTAATLQRIDTLDPQYGAFVTVLAEQAMAQAQELDRNGSNDPQSCGPLHGVPIALKDLLATKGVATTCGTRVLRDWVPEVDATVVQKLRQAGAILIGKVKLTEGAFSDHHPDVQAPKNPWSAEHWTGVSSSGSGVAVAAGMSHGAIGTDTGGSIRFPSASCGIVGIKPTYGRVSRNGVFPLADSLDHIGPMTRSVTDAAIMLQAMAGFDAGDATSLDEPVPTYEAIANSVSGEMAGLRIGVDHHHISYGVSPALHAAVQKALELMASNGAEIVDIQLPPYQALVDGWAVTCGVETALAHDEFWPSRKDDYGPVLSRLIELGHKVSARQYATLEREREQFRFAVERQFAALNLTAMVAPAMPSAPQSLTSMNTVTQEQDVSVEFITFTAPWDYSGHPCLTLPIGMQDGLPLAMQFITALGREDEAIRAGRHYEILRGSFPGPSM